MDKKKSSIIKKIVAVIIALILIVAVSGGLYCVSTKQTPAEAAKTVFTSRENLIVGKWQSQSNPGMSAFIFYEDGTYDSYLSTVNFSGKYEVDGSKLYLKNPTTSKEITYKFNVNEKVLSLQVVEEDGEKSEIRDESKYDRVDELNQKSLSDIIGELASEKTTEK